MSNIKSLRNLILCLLFLNVVKNSVGGICNICVCSQSEGKKILNCEGKREIDNYTEIFDLLAFDDYDGVEKLILSKHEITSLPLDAFRGCKHLKSLDLSENSMGIFEADIFIYLNNLEELDFSFNVLTSLSGSVFDNIQSLLKLNLSNNQLTDLNDTTSGQLPLLTHLDISNNKFENIDSDFIESLVNLEFLDVSFNRIHALPDEKLWPLRSLVDFRATNNLLKTISGEYLPEALKILSVGNNMITSLPRNLSQIRYLNIQDNRISAIESDIEWFKELKHLNISGNVLNTLPNVQFDELSVLDISRNELSIIPETLNLSNFPALDTLVIGGNPIKDFIFNRELRLRNLVARDLNLLESLEANAFQSLKGVDGGCINLTLSQNSRLSLIRYGALNNATLCSLDLSNNNLTRISPEVIKSSGKFLAKNGIDLQGNPLSCDCESQWMLNDLVPHLYKVNPELLEDLRCRSPMELTGTRMVHWFKWKTQVFCDIPPKLLSRMIDAAAVLSDDERVLLESSRGMLAVIAAAMATLCILIIIGILIGRKLAIKRRRTNRRF